MTHAAILLISMLNQGYWIGGQPGEINLRWTTESSLPAAVVEWRLMYGEAKLGSGRVALPPGAKVATLTIIPPKVRATCAVECIFNVKQLESGKSISEARTTLHLYPDDALTNVAARLGAKSLAVIDRPNGLPFLLTEAKIPFTRLDDESKLQFTRYDILVVAQDRLTDRPFGQSALPGQVKNGTSVLVLRQTRVKKLAGYPIQRRATPTKLIWRDSHPLLDDLRVRGLPEREDAWAIQLPADEPALDLVYWPPQLPGKEPAPIDALMVTKTLGHAKLVLCQVPLGDWKRDPLAQRFLADALDFLAAPPEPTPPPDNHKQTVIVPVAPAPQLLEPSPISP